jgi:hypothetical protein
MPPDPAPETPLVGLEEALSLVFDAIALAQKGLENNPSKEEERALNAALIDLDLRRATIEAKLDALIAHTTPVVGPTPAQVAQVAALSAEVETLTSAAVTASAAVVLTTRVLALATEVAPA